MRKFFSIAIASLLIVSSFASCGSTDTETSSSSEAAPAVTEAKEEAETTEAETEEETTEAE